MRLCTWSASARLVDFFSKCGAYDTHNATSQMSATFLATSSWTTEGFTLLFPPPPRLGGVTVQLYNYCSCLRSQINLNLKIPWQILAGFDLEGKLRCHSFCQSFLITEDDWLGHGSCPDNTAAAFRAAKANRYTVMYLASDSFQPQISKGKNDFFIRFQRPIESISMNRWVKS